LACSEDALKKMNIKGNFTDGLYLAPEQLDDLGNTKNQYILVNLILRMM
jgi:hypothetical protein